MVADPADYPWSSHRHYYLGEQGYGPETSLIKGLMAQSGGREIADYELLSEKPVREASGDRPLTPPPAIDQIVDRVVRLTVVPLDRLLSRQRDRSTTNARWLLIYWAAQSGYPLTTIARHLGVSVTGVSKALQAIEEDLRANGPRSERLQQLTAAVPPRNRPAME